MNVVAMAGVALRRLLRDRRALFFMLVLPVVVIIVIGATVSGFDKFRVGVVDNGRGSLAQGLMSEIQRSRGLEVSRYPDEAAMRVALRRSEVSAGIVIPADFDARLRTGASTAIPVLAEQANQAAQGAQTAIAAVIDQHATDVQAASFTASVTKTQQVVDSKSVVLPSGFSYSAPTMLVLFVFINSLALGATTIDNRRLGVYARALAAPIHARSIVIGEVAIAFALAVVQSAIIVTIGAAVFGVSWGSPPAAAALVVAWALVGAGAGMLTGTLFHTPQQASAIGAPLGIALGMLGGCMWPLALVGPTMRTIGHLTPQAWAVDAWTDLLSRGGSLADILQPLAILIAFAIALLTVAVTRLRHILVP